MKADPQQVLSYVELWLPPFGPWLCPPVLHKVVLSKSLRRRRCFSLIKIIITMATVQVVFVVCRHWAKHITCLIAFTPHNSPVRGEISTGPVLQMRSLSLRRNEEPYLRLLSQEVCRAGLGAWDSSELNHCTWLLPPCAPLHTPPPRILLQRYPHGQLCSVETKNSHVVQEGPEIFPAILPTSPLVHPPLPTLSAS